MYRTTRIGVVLMALALIVPVAFAQSTVSVGKKGDVELLAQTRVGSTVLKPGHYRFQHESVDGQHYLVVRAQSSAQLRGGQHYAGATKDEVARVPCRMVAARPDGREISETALHTMKDEDGIARVTQINIGGETEGHIISLEPHR